MSGGFHHENNQILGVFGGVAEPFTTPRVPVRFNATTTSGGYGRLVRQEDGKDAAIIMSTTINIDNMLKSPDNNPVLQAITFAAAPTTAVTTVSPLSHGKRHDFDSGTVIIFDDAPLALGYADNSVGFTSIGEPYSVSDSGLPTGAQTYSGHAVIDRPGYAAAAHITAVTLTVDNFRADQPLVGLTIGGTVGAQITHGKMTASGIPIDIATGLFHSADGGTVAFTSGHNTNTAVINESGGGVVYGQFHGQDAAAVSGGFHHNNNQILGGFAATR